MALCGCVIGVAVGDGVHGAWPLYASAFAVVIVRKSAMSALLQILYSLNQSEDCYPNLASCSGSLICAITFCGQAGSGCCTRLKLVLIGPVGSGSYSEIFSDCMIFLAEQLLFQTWLLTGIAFVVLCGAFEQSFSHGLLICASVVLHNDFEYGLACFCLPW